MDEAPAPGDSGGPIVEERTGTLIGVGVNQLHGIGDFIGVAVVKPGSAQPIASLIPADEVRRALAGRVGARFDAAIDRAGSALLEVKAQIVDPKGMVDAVMVRVAPGVAGTIVPYNEGSWPPVGDTESTELKRDSNSATASGRVQITLSGRGPEARQGPRADSAPIPERSARVLQARSIRPP